MSPTRQRKPFSQFLDAHHTVRSWPSIANRWKVELYIQPADYIPWVFVVLAGAAAILATVVATLNWMEKREDRLERRKALHIVNFDAL